MVESQLVPVICIKASSSILTSLQSIFSVATRTTGQATDPRIRNSIGICPGALSIRSICSSFEVLCQPCRALLKARLQISALRFHLQAGKTRSTVSGYSVRPRSSIRTDAIVKARRLYRRTASQASFPVVTLRTSF